MTEDNSCLVSSEEIPEEIKPPRKANPEPSKDFTGRRLLKDFNFHFLTWSFWMCASLQVMFQNNITTYLKSFHLYNTLLTTLIYVAGTIAKMAFGIGSDFIVHKVPRVTVLISAMVVQTSVLTLCIFSANSFPFMFISVLGVGIPYGATWWLTPTITSEFFGMKYFARNWRLMMIGNAFGVLGLQKIFGAIYDYAIPVKEVKDCYGLNCFRWSFVMVAVLSLCSVIFYVGLLERRIKYRKALKETEMIKESSTVI